LLSNPTVKAIRNKLGSWYDRNRRDLPWRRTRDPYAIWISEIMLQQTRVAAVIPYYEKFLSAFPNAAALAVAPEEQVLAMWSGLGYYSRARNLQKTAKMLVQNTAEAPGFHRDFTAIRVLPGIGDYTAAAISSIAFGLPHAAVDGNVRRVIVRLANNDAADIPSIASQLLDRKDPGRWNQAVMELGATICTPRDPQCAKCPIAKHCEAHTNGTQASLPAKRRKPEPEHLERVLLIVERGHNVLLVPSTRVKGFWDLPELPDNTRTRGILATQPLGSFRHAITHRHYKFVVYKGRVNDVAGRLGKLHRWVPHPKLHEIPLSTTAKKAMRCLDQVAGTNT
jgi:A/G-specific adenine glycosylase